MAYNLLITKGEFDLSQLKNKISEFKSIFSEVYYFDSEKIYSESGDIVNDENFHIFNSVVIKSKDGFFLNQKRFLSILINDKIDIENLSYNFSENFDGFSNSIEEFLKGEINVFFGEKIALFMNANNGNNKFTRTDLIKNSFGLSEEIHILDSSRKKHSNKIYYFGRYLNISNKANLGFSSFYSKKILHNKLSEPDLVRSFEKSKNNLYSVLFDFVNKEPKSIINKDFKFNRENDFIAYPPTKEGAELDRFSKIGLNNVLYFTDKPTDKLIKMSKSKREAELKNKFCFKFDSESNLINKKLVIIDDVVTTQSTIREIYKTAIDCGFKNENILILAAAKKTVNEDQYLPLLCKQISNSDCDGKVYFVKKSKESNPIANIYFHCTSEGFLCNSKNKLFDEELFNFIYGKRGD